MVVVNDQVGVDVEVIADFGSIVAPGNIAVRNIAVGLTHIGIAGILVKTIAELDRQVVCDLVIKGQRTKAITPFIAIQEFVGYEMRVVVPGQVIVALLQTFFSFDPVIFEVIDVDVRTDPKDQVVQVVGRTITNGGIVVGVFAVIGQFAIHG